jgi:predicted transcriptional regulator
MADLKHQDCHCCEGSGKELDHKAVGSVLRNHRVVKGITQTSIADRMGLSKPYLSDLEHGKRAWRPSLIKAYEKALK